MLVFAFEPKLTTNVLDNLNCDEKYYLRSSELAINDLLKYLNKLRPFRCVGLGQYSGKDQTNIRIETACTNAFRRQPRVIEELQLSSFLINIPGTKISRGMGNSWCNLVSYKIATAVAMGELELEYSFLHIPKSLNQREATFRVASLLKT